MPEAHAAPGIVKCIELLGRRFLVSLVGLLLGARRRPLRLPDRPNVLVLRLDERVGNLVMLTPLLAELKRRLPRCSVTVLGTGGAKDLFAGDPRIDAYWVFRKRALFSADGPIGILARLRRARFDLAIDASNPTDPSATQALLVRLSGAAASLGVDRPGFGRLFSAPVEIPDPEAHEIDLRLALLRDLPGAPNRPPPSLSPPSRPASPGVSAALAAVAAHTRPIVVNVGARLVDKQLRAADYASLIAVAAARAPTLVTFGPKERGLAAEALRLAGAGALAPDTDLVDLRHLFTAARAVVSCDTGPMHVAVACGTPTCGIFVSTEPRRYGYPSAPHLVLDARAGWTPSLLERLAAWLPRPD